MIQVRLAAAILAAFTLAIAALLNTVLGVGFEVVSPLLAAATSLIVVAPLRTRRSAARDRLTVACIVYAVAMGMALVLAVRAGIQAPTASALLILTMAGIALAIWAAKLRKTRVPTAWANYYDN